MSEQQTYHFYNAMNGVMNLQNCTVHLYGTTNLVNNYGGQMTNYGKMNMINNYQTNVREKVVYRDRVVEKKVTERVFISDPGNSKELEKMRTQIEKLRKENNRLKRATGIENGLRREREIEELRKTVEYLRSQLSEEKELIQHLQENNIAFARVNKSQAERISFLEHQAKTKPDEYEPTRNDIKMITRNMHLFLDEEERNYYGV